MRISRRLKQIEQMITQDYDHIWDCCCDHGLLGLSLLEREVVAKVHFVDAVAPLMAELEQRLLKHSGALNSPERWQVHCMDLARLRLPVTDKLQRHLIIIAGVGGDLIVDLVLAILEAHPGQPLEFLLCPVHHNYKVRQALAAEGLGLVDEVLVKEKGQFYEVMHVSKGAPQSLSPVGSLMWDLSRDADRDYLNRTIAHYERRSIKDQKVLSIVQAYQALLSDS
ncbi:MAG: tRNA (adenine(22)-N(1))-methyltransferase [Pontibacterium sp.]